MLVLSDKHVSLRVLTALPLDPDNPTVAEIAAGTEEADKIVFANFALGPTGSDSGTDPSLSGQPNAYFGVSQYAGTLPVFRYLDADGKPVAADDALWTKVKEKGSKLVLALREGVAWDSEPVAGQEVSIYVATTDDPQPSDRTGYVKYTVPLAISEAHTYKTIVAGF